MENVHEGFKKKCEEHSTSTRLIAAATAKDA